MFGKILEMVVYVIIALLAVKLFYVRGSSTIGKTEPDGAKQSVSWKSALDAMSVMEDRLAHLQARDLKNQERIWKLEDENNDLKARLARTTQELLRVTKRDTARPQWHDDDDSHDIDGSIPPGN